MMTFVNMFLVKTNVSESQILAFLVKESRISESRVIETGFLEPNAFLTAELLTVPEALFHPAFLAYTAFPESVCACTTADHQCCEGKYQ